MLIHWIWLATRPSMNDRQKRLVQEAFGEAEDIFFAEEKAIMELEGISADGKAALLDKSLNEAAKILDQCVDREISVCTIADEEYPERLKNIIDPPLVLYYKGQLPSMGDVPVIAAVGTRKPSLYGQNVAMRIGYQIADCGGMLVSGLAEGNDANAMRGALMAGGTVVGVLGSGVDIVYPKCNRQLFEEIGKRGCLLSEFPPETPPFKWNFPKRNRIMSGLSNGVVVIEAPERSGTLITARQAAEQGRDVFVVPGNVDAKSFDGSQVLLRDGATPVRNGWDVLSEYENLYPGKIRFPDPDGKPQSIAETERAMPKVAQKPASSAKKPPIDKKKEKKPIDKEEKPPYSDLKDILPALNDAQRDIVELLTTERLKDDIIAQSGLPAAKVTAELTMLRIKGIVEQLPGNRFKLKETIRKWSK